MLASPRLRRGDTLLEVVATVVLMSIGIVGVVSGIGVLLGTTAVSSRQADADLALREWTEFLKSPSVAYVSCAGTSTSSYSAASLGVPVPGRMSAKVRSVELATVPSGTSTSSSYTPVPSTCTETSDTGVQRIVVEVVSTDGRVSRSAAVVKRK